MDDVLDQVEETEVEGEEVAEPGLALVPTAGRDLEELDITPVFQEGFLTLAPLEQDGAVVAFAELDQLTSRVSGLSRNSKWWLGDLYCYASEHYGDEWHQLTDDMGHTVSELMEISYMAALFAPEKRLVPTEGQPGLTWNQHKLFAKFYEGNTRKAMALMKKAAKQGWDDSVIRDEIRKATSVEVEAKEVDNDRKAPSTKVTFAILVPAEQGGQAVQLVEEAEANLTELLKAHGLDLVSITHRVSGSVPTKE